MQTNAIGWQDIAERYHMGERLARQRIRDIREFIVNHTHTNPDAPKGYITDYELLAWEQHRAQKKGCKQ